jgi:hypothetical protein
MKSAYTAARITHKRKQDRAHVDAWLMSILTMPAVISEGDDAAIDELLCMVCGDLIGSAFSSDPGHRFHIMNTLVYTFNSVSSHIARVKVAYYAGRLAATRVIEGHSPEHWLRWTIEQAKHTDHCPPEEADCIKMFGDLAFITLATIIPWRDQHGLHPTICRIVVLRLRERGLWGDSSDLRDQVMSRVRRAATALNDTATSDTIIEHIIGERTSRNASAAENNAGSRRIRRRTT